MELSIEKELLDKCRQENVWDLGNKVLYDLCAKHFAHKVDEVIVAKTWLIGRSYAVALERRNTKKEINDVFYSDKIVKAFMKFNLDKRLDTLKSHKSLTKVSLLASLKTHHDLTKMLKVLTELNKRSFASKYLHFHLPNLFFIYDSRAVNGMSKFVKRAKGNRDLINNNDVDKEYANFACKCYELQQEIKNKYDVELSCRELDNLLVEVANRKLVKNEKGAKI